MNAPPVDGGVLAIYLGSALTVLTLAVSVSKTLQELLKPLTGGIRAKRARLAESGAVKFAAREAGIDPRAVDELQRQLTEAERNREHWEGRATYWEARYLDEVRERDLERTGWSTQLQSMRRQIDDLSTGRRGPT